MSRDLDKGRPADEVLDWHEFFMGTAYLAGMRSKDPVIQVGACIVNEEKKIVGTGYDGMPNSCKDNQFSWKRKILEDGEFASRMEVDEDDVFSAKETKNFYVCHAELNAIINTNSNEIKGSVMYVVQFPCNHCAKAIIQSGIKSLVYCVDRNDEISNQAAEKMFHAAEIHSKKLTLKKDKIVIEFPVKT